MDGDAGLGSTFTPLSFLSLILLDHPSTGFIHFGVHTQFVGRWDWKVLISWPFFKYLKWYGLAHPNLNRGRESIVEEKIEGSRLAIC